MLHQTLVNKLKSDGHIRSNSVEAAFRAVPRHLFLPGLPLEEVYRDQAISTKRLDGLAVSSSSQPTVMAMMLEQLDLEPGHRVLEIGAGTGYNAALMAHIVGDAGEVVTLDIDEDIVEAARAHLATAGLGRVRVICGDGAFGCPVAAPFDRIILTVAAVDISPAWREQLKPDGRLLLPLRIGGILTQKSVLFKRAEDHLASVSVRDCTFLMLRGAHAMHQEVVRLGSEPDLHFWADELEPIDPDILYRQLTGPSQDVPTGGHVTQREAWSGLIFWLGLREPSLCGFAAAGAVADRGDMPWLASYRSVVKTCTTVGFVDELGLALLTRPTGRAQAVEAGDGAESWELLVRSFGNANHFVQCLVNQVAAWNAAGRLSGEGLQIRAYLPDTAHLSSSVQEIIIQKPWTRLVLNWL